MVSGCEACTRGRSLKRPLPTVAWAREKERGSQSETNTMALEGREWPAVPEGRTKG